MAKNPIFPLYYNDIDRSTRDWSDEEFGAYMRLLMHQWDKGFLPNDYQRLTRIATSLSTTWSMLKDKFPENGEGLKNPVLEVIRDKVLKHREKQKENILKRYQTSTKHITKTIPLEDENEKEDEIVKNNNKEDRKKEFLTNQKWKDEFCMAKSLKMPELEKLQNEFIVDTDLKGEHVDSYKRYFTNWFNKHKNGSTTHKQSASGTKSGTSDRRTEAARKW